MLLILSLPNRISSIESTLLYCEQTLHQFLMIAFSHIVAVGDGVTGSLITQQVLLEDLSIIIRHSIVRVNFQTGVQWLGNNILGSENVVAGQHVRTD